MRHMARAVLVALLAFGCSSSSDGGGGTDGTSDTTTGTDGTTATDGTTGTTGADGTDGADGTTGADGTDGTTGADGTDGTTACTPECTNKNCGDDGCGGICGTCGDGDECKPSGQCGLIGCDPFCTNKQCGDDGCGGNCGICETGTCTAQGTCEAGCVPDCTDKQCGDDGCGGSCGECTGASELCSTSGECVDTTTSNCGQASSPETGCTSTATMCLCVGCADDGGCDPNSDDCICGDCSADAWCTDLANCNGDGTCDPWNEGCLCSDCAAHPYCPPCEPQCSGKTCGDDGCGGTCGECAGTEFCSETQQCETCGCDGKDCGDDGCGTSCGTCESGSVCDPAQQCATLAAGNGCSVAIEIASAPSTVTGNSGDKLDLHQTDGSCGEGDAGGIGTGYGDMVYSFTPAVTGVYNLAVAPTTEGGAFPPGIAVYTACEDTTATMSGCVGFSGDLYNDGAGGNWDVTLESDTAYLIVVDGLFDGDGGEYTFTVGEPCVPACGDKACGGDGCGGSCGTCGDGTLCEVDGTCADAATVTGNTCANPFTLGADSTAAGDTNNSTDTFEVTDGLCGPLQPFGGDGVGDHWYAFTPTVSGVYSFSITGDASFGYAYSIHSGDCGALTCMAGSSFGEANSLELVADTTYYIVVDGFPDETFGLTGQGAYELSVSAACVPACDGKTCGNNGCEVGTCGTCGDGTACDSTQNCVDPAGTEGAACVNPFAIDALPFTATKDSSAGLDAYNASACDATGGQNAPDQVYAFTPESAGVYTLTLSTEGDSSFIWYVTTDCTFGDDACVDVGTSSGFLQLEAATEYFIVVDGAGDGEMGSYTLALETCTPQCDGKTCGDDACGGNCGECGDSETCIDEGATASCVAATCDGACGAQSATGCYCDTGCFDYGDCCLDVCDFCSDQAPSQPCEFTPAP